MIGELLPGTEKKAFRPSIPNLVYQYSFYANYDNDRNTLPGIKHTAWALYNSVSEWSDHQRRVRGKGELARVESRLVSNWFGTSHRIKQVAYGSALELAGLN